MSTGPTFQTSSDVSEQARKKIDFQINRLFEEVARLSESELGPNDYYGEFLQRVVSGIAAPAAAVWIRTTQGNLQLQFHINLPAVGLDRSETHKAKHDELLRNAMQSLQPMLIPPQSGSGTADSVGNPTDFLILMAPILIGQQIAGIVEVWQDATRNPGAHRGYLQFVAQMASLASHYARNRQLRQITGQQQLWTNLETFARQVHGSLDPTQVAYLVANEGRRLVECDRISVAIRMGRKVTIEAVSGADVVERRSNLVRLQRALCERVIKWGERLVYSGVKDDTLPPDVLHALDQYLEESPSKLLVVLPLRDERETDLKRKPRSALLMEAFEPTNPPEQYLARLEVVGKHAAPALYNSVEHRRIPMRFLWMPLAAIQEGLGGKTRAILWSCGIVAFVFLVAMVIVPYPLRMEAKGQLLPVERAQVFSPYDGVIIDISVEPNSQVSQNQLLVLMREPRLSDRVAELQAQIQAAEARKTEAEVRLSQANLTPIEKASASAQLREQRSIADSRRMVLNTMLQGIQMDSSRREHFWIKSPIRGTVLNSDFREYRNRPIKPSDPILRIGDKDGAWEIEVKIPQKHISQILLAYPPNDRNAELDVDLLLASAPTRVYRGKLQRDKIGGEAAPNRDEHNESEPVVVAWVRIDGPDVAEGDRIPRELLVAGTEVHTRIRCGNRAMGYSLFYGVWEYLYENVIFRL